MTFVEERPIPATEFTSEERLKAEMLQIDELLEKLKGFEIDRPYGKSDRSDRGLELLKGFLESNKGWFIDNKILLIYHGSLQYHDPVNLDIDATFVYQDRKQAEENRQRFHKIGDEMEGIVEWPAQDCSSNLAYISMSELEDAAEYHEREQDVVMFNHFLYDHQMDTNDADEYIAEILSSLPVFPEQQALLTEYQQMSRQLLLDPSRSKLRQGVAENLKDVIEIREERREKLRKIRNAPYDYWT